MKIANIILSTTVVLLLSGCGQLSGEEIKDGISQCTDNDLGFMPDRNGLTMALVGIDCCVPGTLSWGRTCITSYLPKDK